MTSFVVDASLAVEWVVTDEQTPVAEALLERVKLYGGRAPDLFWHEMRNVLIKIERQRRSAPWAAERAMLGMRRLPIAILANRADLLVLELARTYELSSYDAAYLDLAMGYELPLATFDGPLAAAARACGVELLGPLAP